MANSRDNPASRELGLAVASQFKEMGNEELYELLDRPAEVIIKFVQGSHDGCTGRFMGGVNNINILFQRENEPESAVVIQRGTYKEAVKIAIDQLSAEGRPDFLPRMYAQRIIFSEEDKQFSTRDFTTMSIVENCYESLERRVGNVHKQNAENPILLAASIGIQLSELLTKLSEKDILWLDLKLGNILLSKDGSIITPDTKCFYPAAMLLMSEGKRPAVNFMEMGVTPSFLSRDFLDNKMETVDSRKKAKVIWEKEYSYQMAVILYKVATGLDRINFNAGFDHKTPIPQNEFDWNHPVFNSPEGQELKDIIEKLAQDGPKNRYNPASRMDHKEAAKRLSKLRSKIEARESAASAASLASAASPAPRSVSIQESGSTKPITVKRASSTEDIRRALGIMSPGSSKVAQAQSNVAVKAPESTTPAVQKLPTPDNVALPEKTGVDANTEPKPPTSSTPGMRR